MIKERVIRFVAVTVMVAFMLSIPEGCKVTANKSEVNNSRKSSGKFQPTVQYSEPVTLTLGWDVADINDRPIIKYWVDSFTKKYPNIRIEYYLAEHDVYENKLRLNAQTNSLPDVFWLDILPSGIPLIKAGACIELTPFLDENIQLKQSFGEGVFDTTKIDGKIWGIPYAVQYEGWFYNKRIFDRFHLAIPKTFDEFKNTCAIFSKNGITPIAFGAKDTWSVWWFQYFLKRYGFYELKEDILTKKAKFDNPQCLKAYKRLAELYAIGAFSKDAAVVSNNQAKEMFITGKSPIYGTGTWELGNLCNSDFAVDIVFDWAPVFSDGVSDQKDGCMAYHSVLMVGNSAKYKMNAVMDLFKYFFSPEMATQQLKLGEIPVIKFDASNVKVNPLIKQVISKSADKIKPFPQIEPLMPVSFSEPYWDSVIGTALGILTPEEAVKKLDEWNVQN